MVYKNSSNNFILKYVTAVHLLLYYVIMSSFVIMSLIPVVSHDSEQVDKQVDKVEI